MLNLFQHLKLRNLISWRFRNKFGRTTNQKLRNFVYDARGNNLFFPCIRMFRIYFMIRPFENQRKNPKRKYHGAKDTANHYAR